MKTPLVLLALVAVASARALTVSMTPLTVVPQNFAGAIQINGSVTVAPGETFFFVSLSAVAFKSGFTAGFNGAGNGTSAAFNAWNGVGTYTGPIYDIVSSSANLGFAAGMPQGLYGTNPFGPNGLPGITIQYATPTGANAFASANFAIQVVPEPASFLALMVALGALKVRRRR